MRAAPLLLALLLSLVGMAAEGPATAAASASGAAVSASAPESAASATRAAPIPPAPPALTATAAGRIAYIPVDGVIDEHRHRQFERALDAALAAKVDTVVVHLTTDGGRLDSAMKMVNRAMQIPRGRPRMVAYIDNRAYSAGALIAYGHDEIYLAPAAAIGDIGVITINSEGKIEYLPEKIETVVRTLLRQTAQVNGWDEAKMVKMTARNQELYRFDLPDGRREWVIEDNLQTWLADHPAIKADSKIMVLGKDRLLTYTAQEAVKDGMAHGLIKDLDDLWRHLGVKPAEVQRYEPSQNEKVAETLGGWAPLLAAVAVLLVIMEFKAPAGGMWLIGAGVVGVLFFLCQYYQELAGMPEVILVVVGFGLAALEIFLLPTGGWLAGAGALMVITGLILAFMPDNIQFTPSTEGWGSSMAHALYLSLLALAIMTGGVVMAILAAPAWIARSRAGRSIAAVGEITATSAGEAEQHADQLVGKEGVARTALRPTGFVTIAGRDLAAAAEQGRHIPAGDAVVVTAMRFGEAIVRPKDPA